MNPRNAVTMLLVLAVSTMSGCWWIQDEQEQDDCDRALATVCACPSVDFAVCGTVTRCSDGTPLVGVRAQLSLESGVSDSEDATAYSSPDGHYCVMLNEPPASPAKLSLDKPMFTTVEESFSEAPDGDRDYCLAVAPSSNAK